MDGSALLRQIFKFDMLYKQERYKAAIRQNLWKFLFLNGILVGFFIGSFQNQPTNKIWVLSSLFTICAIFNLVYFFYDPSLRIHTSVRNVSGFRKIDTNSIVSSLCRVNTSSESLFQAPMRNHHSFFQEGNLALFQNLWNNHAIATMGVQLKAVPFHIQANFNDFLRKIAELEDFVPLNFQVDLINAETRIESSRLENMQIPTKIGSQTSMNYRIFFSRTSKHVSRKTIENLVMKMSHIALCIKEIIEINFPHYHFEILKGLDLVKGIKSAWSKEEITEEKYVFQDTNLPLKGMKYLSRHFIALCCNLIIFMYGGIITYPHFPYLLYFAGLYFIYSLRKSILHFKATYYFRQNSVLETFLPVNLFPENEHLFLDPEDDVWVYSPERQKITCRQQFTFSQLNRAYRQNNTKLYRALMNTFNNSNSSLCHNFFLDRVIPNEMEEFKAFLNDQDYAIFEKFPERRKAIERNYSGFFRFQVQFILASEFSLELLEDLLEVYHSKKRFARERYVQILNLAYPSCKIRAAPNRIFFQSLSKNRRGGSYSTPLQMFCAAGTDLSEVIMIPEEIHRALPMYYAGEFSTPFLNDEILFGSTFNPENFMLESEGGINLGELWGNILIAGDDHTRNTRVLMRMIKALMKSQMHAIVFDWEGDWKFYADYLSPLAANEIQILEVGDDFGLKLFDLPIMNAGEDQLSYMEKTLDIFGRIFHWNPDQLSVLRSAWLSENKTNSRNLSRIVEHIEAMFDKSPILRDKSEVYTVLQLFQAQQYLIAFDKEIGQKLNPYDLIESPTTFILDLSRLKLEKYKNLFIQIFLTQLQFLMGDYEADTKILPKIVVLPHLHALFNQRTDLRSHGTMKEMFAEFLTLQMPIIAETCQVTDVHDSLLDNFETIMALRTAQFNRGRLLGSLLKFDGKFTNTSQQSSRISSYQFQYMASLDFDQCIIHRSLFQKPYVFSFTDLPSPHSDSNFVLPQNIPLHWAKSSQYTLSQNKPTFTTTLHVEFHNQPSIIEKLHIYLNSCADKLVTYKVIPKHSLLDDLENLLDMALRNLYPSDIKQRKEKIATILEDLISFKYLVKKTHQPNTGIEVSGYVLSKKAEECVQQYHQFDKLKRASSSQTKILKGDEIEIMMSNTSGNTEISQQVSANGETELSLEDEPTITDLKPPSTPVIAPPMDTINPDAYEWQNTLRSSLIDVLIETRTLFQTDGFDKAIQFLNEQWQEGETSLDLIPNARSTQQILRDKLLLLNHLAIPDEAKFHQLLDKLEDYAVTI